MSILIISTIVISVLFLVFIISYIIISKKNSNKYSCKNNSCVLDPNGMYSSLDKCKDACKNSPEPSSTSYSCINNSCVIDSNGMYSSLDKCKNACETGPEPEPQPKPEPSSTNYSCVNNSCVIDFNGMYSSLDKCQDVCEVSPHPSSTNYSCVNNGCVSDSKGVYKNLIDCNKNCKSSDIKCIDNTSFQKSAQDNLIEIYGNFYKCLSNKDGFSCGRAQEILSLRDYLSIFSFAYFPLNPNIKLVYTTHSINKKNIDKPSKSERKITSDPVEIVIYYTGELYTLIGDIGDAKTGKNAKRQHVLTKLLKRLKESCEDVFRENTMKDSTGNQIKGLTWDKYFKYPGPFGRKWDDDTTVNWTITTDYKDINNALYLDPRDFLSNQFWGKNIPIQGSTTSQAILSLVKSQIDESIKKYNNLLDLGGDSQKWATDKILNNSKNIDTYHIFRKAIRSLERTVEKFPSIISGFYRPLSQQLVSYVNKKYDLSVSTEQTYGDVLCLHNFTCGPNKIIYPIANLIFIGAFDPSFYGLTDNNFKCIRSLLLLKLGGLGDKNIKEFSKNYLKNAIPCPSHVPNYKNTPYTWKEPTIDNDNGNISGSICELVDFFGDIHDQLVPIQQQIDKNEEINQDLFNYCVGSCQSLEKFMNSINMIQVLKDLNDGLCQQ